MFELAQALKTACPLKAENVQWPEMVFDPTQTWKQSH